MTGQVHWLPFVVLLIAVSPVLAFWLYGRYSAKRYRVEEATVRCRKHDNQLVHLLLVRDRKTSEPIGVRRCTAHANPEDVRCDKHCLPMFVHVEKAENAQKVEKTT